MSPNLTQSVLSSLIPGILCNDSTLIISADSRAGTPRSAPSTPTAGTSSAVVEGVNDSVGDIELGKVQPPSVAGGSDSKKSNSVGFEVEGDPTERCILDLAVSLMGVPQSTKQMLQRNLRIGEIPFDSATKYMATLHALTPELSSLLLGSDKTSASTGTSFLLHTCFAAQLLMCQFFMIAWLQMLTRE